MNDAVQAILLALPLWGSWASIRVPGAPRHLHDGRLPVATLCALFVVGLPSLLQLTVAPWLLDVFGRVPDELATGQLWRLATSLLVQDGGWPGTLFNLVALAFVGVAGERIWSWRQWVVIWLGSGIASQLWGLVVQPVGAGTSVANFGLAASIAVVAVWFGAALSRALGVISLAVGLVLLAFADIHGGAVVLGAAIGLVLGRQLRVASADGVR